MIRIKRVYEDAARDDGRRILIERLWLRGMRKEALLSANYDTGVPDRVYANTFYTQTSAGSELEPYREPRRGDDDHASRASPAFRSIFKAMRAADTTAQSHVVQPQIYRRLGGSGRAQLAGRLSAEIREISRAGIRGRHAEYSDEDVDHALRRILYGDDLFRRAWPRAPLLAP